MWACGVEFGWPILEALDEHYGGEVVIAPSVPWLPDAIQGPALYAGFYFAINDGRLPDLFRDSPSFAASLQRAEVVVAPQNPRQAKCVRLLPLSDIVGHSEKLSDQVEFAARWAVRAFDDIVGLQL